jgi:replicative DNA helicase
MDFDELDLRILKTILTNKKYALEFSYECGHRLFHVDLWKFSKQVIEYIRLYKEVPTKRIILEQNANNKSALEYVMSIFAKLDLVKYDDREYKYDLQKLKARFSEKLIESLKDSLTANDIKKDVNEIQTTLNSIKSINQVKSYRKGSFIDYAEDFKETYNAKLKNPDFGVGLKTGYSFLDYITNGLRPGELFLCAGITSSGKSLLLMNLAIQMWLGSNLIQMNDNFRRGCNVLLFSLEMSYEDYMMRAISRLAMVQQTNIRDANLSDEDVEKVKQAFEFIKKYNHTFTVIDLPRRATIDTIESMIDEHTSQYGKPDAVAIDYLNLMSLDVKDEDDWLEQAKISEKIHELGRAKEIVMLSAVQLNPKGKIGEFGIKDFRRATQIADNADIIGVINTRKDEKNYPDFSIDIVKNRRGELISGKLQKKFGCSAILDMTFDKDTDTEDLSGHIV